MEQKLVRSKLIFNQNTHQNGLVFQKDVICFDEVNKGHSAFLEVVPKLQQIMASGRVERYDMEVMTDVSLVFQGNIKFTVRSGKRSLKETIFWNMNYLYRCMIVHFWTEFISLYMDGNSPFMILK